MFGMTDQDRKADMLRCLSLVSVQHRMVLPATWTALDRALLKLYIVRGILTEVEVAAAVLQGAGDEQQAQTVLDQLLTWQEEPASRWSVATECYGCLSWNEI